MAKKKGCLFKIGIALLIFIGLIFVLFCMVLIMPSEEYETVNYDIPNMRDYYTHIKGDGEDKVTLMVYICLLYTSGAFCGKSQFRYVEYGSCR